MTLYEYFIRQNANTIIDHSIRATVRPDGSVSFYIHPAQVSGDTADFVLAKDGELIEGPWQPPSSEAPEKIPKDLDEAVEMFIARMADDHKQWVQENNRFPHCWHHSGGMHLRNLWGLWTGSELARWFESKGITHADDMSGIISEAVVASLCGTPFNLAEKISETQAFWSKKENGGCLNGIPPAPWKQA